MNLIQQPQRIAFSLALLTVALERRFRFHQAFLQNQLQQLIPKNC